jgi:hypothetical protein
MIPIFVKLPLVSERVSDYSFKVNIGLKNLAAPQKRGFLMPGLTLEFLDFTNLITMLI